jgi:hypothetical protein
MAHDIGPGRRQFSQPSPHATQARNVEEVVAVLEADLHPGIVIGKVTAPPPSIEGPTLSVR